jgi:DegV family protein with EDD domain
MERIGIVTDSTSDVPPDLAAEWGISVIPCQITFGETTYLDGVDLSAEAFYEKLALSPEPPRTSQPSVQAFVTSYRHLLEQEHCQAVFSIHLAGTLSGTINAAWAAAQALADPTRVVIIDSGQLSMAVGWLVIKAAQAARSGATRTEVAEVLRGAQPRLRTVAMIDTLENLYRGGRIRLFTAALGTALHIKPLVSLEEGELTVWNKVRTHSKALDALVNRLEQMGPFDELAVLHARAQDLAQLLAGRLEETRPSRGALLLPVGAAVVSHLGLGAVGACALLAQKE